MSRAARSVLVFGVYLLGTAAILIVTPNTLLGLLRIAPTSEPWIRVLGVVAGALGTYYIVAARNEFEPFFRASVWIRYLVLVGFSGLAVAGLAPPAIIGFGIIDSLGAMWTSMALRPRGSAA